jgi:hypothetical protein
MSQLSDKVLEVSKPYLGPAAESFLARQCKHLNIEMSALGPANVKDLAKWVEQSAALIMDAPKAAELANKIAAM